MAKETLKFARQDVPKLIESAYIHREELIKKLKNSLSLVHFSIDMWTSPAKTEFQVIGDSLCGDCLIVTQGSSQW